MDLKTEVSELKGIGPKKARAFRDAGIVTLSDLMEFFPRRYEDRRTVTPISSARAGTDMGADRRRRAGGGFRQGEFVPHGD